MKRLLIVVILVAAGIAGAQELSAVTTSMTVKRRLTEVEQKAALLFHEDNWIAYRIMLYDRHLKTDLGPSMRAHLTAMKAEAEKAKAKHVTWGKTIWLSCTNVVTDQTVKWSEIVSTNKITTVEKP